MKDRKSSKRMTPIHNTKTTCEITQDGTNVTNTTIYNYNVTLITQRPRYYHRRRRPNKTPYTHKIINIPTESPPTLPSNLLTTSPRTPSQPLVNTETQSIIHIPTPQTILCKNNDYGLVFKKDIHNKQLIGETLKPYHCKKTYFRIKRKIKTMIPCKYFTSTKEKLEEHIKKQHNTP